MKAGINQRLTQNGLPGSGFAQAGTELVVMSRHVQSPNLETPNRCITKLILRKHRNRPVGCVQLLFEPQFTRFRNLAA